MSVIFDDHSVLLGMQGVIEVSVGDIEEWEGLFSFLVQVGFVVGHDHTLAVHSHDDVRIFRYGQGLDLVVTEEYFHGLHKE